MRKYYTKDKVVIGTGNLVGTIDSIIEQDKKEIYKIKLEDGRIMYAPREKISKIYGNVT